MRLLGSFVGQGGGQRGGHNGVGVDDVHDSLVGGFEVRVVVDEEVRVWIRFSLTVFLNALVRIRMAWLVGGVGGWWWLEDLEFVVIAQCLVLKLN